MSLSKALNRLSNSPRTPVPAIRADKSRESKRLSCKDYSNGQSSELVSFESEYTSGTSLLTIRCASPSSIAVLLGSTQSRSILFNMTTHPTPGRPNSTGLLFVRLDNICIVRLISASLPITGSSFPCFAKSVKSIEYCFNVSPFSGPCWPIIVPPGNRIPGKPPIPPIPP